MRPKAALLTLSLALCAFPIAACSPEHRGAGSKTPETPSPSSGVTSLSQTAGTDKVVSLAVTEAAITARFVKDGATTAWMLKQGKASQFKARPVDPAAAVSLERIDLGAIEQAADAACPAAASQLTLALTDEHALTLLRCGKEKEAAAVLVDGKTYPEVENRFSEAGMTNILAMAQAASPKGGPLAVDLSHRDAMVVTVPDATGPLGKECRAPELLLPLTAKGSVTAVQAPVCNTTKQKRPLTQVELAGLDPKKTATAFMTAAARLNSTLASCQMMEIRRDGSGRPVAAVTCTSQGTPASASIPIG